MGKPLHGYMGRGVVHAPLEQFKVREVVAVTMEASWHCNFCAMNARSFLLKVCLLFFGYSVSAQPAGRVLMIGIDGVRPDALVEASTPHLDALMAEGFSTLDALNDDITMSGPGWSSIHCGVRSGKHNVIDNSFSNQNFLQYPGWLERIEALYPEWNTASICQWGPINDQIVGASADVVLNTNSAEAAAAAAVQQMENGDPHAIFVHLDDPDYAGHSTGFSPSSAPYLTAISEMDEQVGLMVSSLQSRANYVEENWMVLVTTDHGGTGTSHGGNSEGERRVFILASSPTLPVEVIERDTLWIGLESEDCLGLETVLNFAGDDRVILADHPDFLVGADQDFTVEMRLRSTEAADVAMVGNKDWDSGLNPGWVFSFEYPNGPAWKVNVSDGSNRVDADGQAGVADGQWHTLTASFDRDGMMRLYTDGAFNAETDISSLGSLDVGGGMSFGADVLGGYAMTGQLAEVRFWGKVLEEDAISQWHCSSLSDAHPDWADLRGYWALNEGQGFLALDGSGNGHQGVIQGPTWSANEAPVIWDYAGTPRLVDVPVTALAHMCVPIDPAWNLDGVALSGTCYPGTAAPCPEDVNGDGVISVVDLLLVLGVFGQPCG
ncbi:alkaline phosphatase family protein [Flavobacteriales bacterium]|nr:alkaline phosphatase family protein [Flavobacteriales bacterium]